MDSGSKSKVAAMVEQLQDTLATQRLANPKSKPEVRNEGPSSSSPLPEVGAADDLGGALAVSPLQTKQKATLPMRMDLGVAESAVDETSSMGQQLAKVHTVEVRSMQPNDSVISAPLQLQSKARLPAYKRPSITRTSSANAPILTAGPTLAKPIPAISVELDEFADDLELSAQDIEELMTQPPPLHQRPLHQIPAHPDPPPQQELGANECADPKNDESVTRHVPQQTEAIVIQDDDDEFGCDDIDEATFQQAEFSATQAMRASYPLSHLSHK